MILNRGTLQGVPNEVAMRSLRRGSDTVWVPSGGPYRAAVPIQVMHPGALHGFGIGQAASTAQTTVTDSYVGGLSIWTNPAVAVQAIVPAIQNISSFPMTALGVLTPPAAALLLVMSMFGGGSGKKR
jgi:hypothetical protein